MDGLKLYLQSAGHADIQEKYYNDSQVPEFGNFMISWREYFCRLGQSAAFLYTSCQDHLGSSAPTRELRKLDLQKKQATSARQMAEWGMRVIQTSFLG